MLFETLFAAVTITALLSWLALILLPRWRLLTAGLQWGTVLGLAVLYTTLIVVFFTRNEAGSILSLAGVQSLFQSIIGALAGWVHYLALDLFVGLWVARRADQIGLSRLAQAPVLLLTMVFAPIGLLVFHAILAGKAYVSASQIAHPPADRD